MNINLLKAARVRSGYTQKELAEKIDIGETSYTKRENASTSFSIDEAKSLIHELKLSDTEVIEIFFRD